MTAPAPHPEPQRRTRGRGRFTDGAANPLGTIGATIAPAGAVLAVQLVLFPVPTEVWLQGLVLGLLNALLVVGLVLVHRTNRVVNFAQASIGVAPASLAGGLVLFGTPSALTVLGLTGSAAAVIVIAGLGPLRLRPAVTAAAAVATAVIVAGGLGVPDRFGWWGGLIAGIVAAALCGLAIDAIVISRFRTTPRLVVTVATIGLAQLFAVGALLVPRLWGRIMLLDPDGRRTGFETPFDWELTIGNTIFRSAELLAVIIAIAGIAAVTLVLRRTDVGVAMRAAADRTDRAAMLGIPVPRLEAGVWMLAAVLAFLATYLQAGILGIELTAGIGLRVMVAALGAMALGGFSSLPAMLLAATAIGVIQQATGPAGGRSLTFTDAVLAAIVLIGLLVRRTSARRSDQHGVSSWTAVDEPRGLPHELARIAGLRALEAIAVLLVVAAGLALPLLLPESDVLRASTVVALVLLAVSVVVLTGWTGEVTLGQMSFAATGASVAAWGTVVHRFDLTLCLLAGGLAAAVVAMIVALPSLRWHGIFLAVTTLAFSLAAANYLFNPTVATWIPAEDIVRRPLFGTIDLDGRTAMYETAFIVLVLCILLVVGVRRSRVGRILRAVRDNPDAARAHGIRVPLARLTAFGLSGFLAGIGGVLLFYVHERYEIAAFSASESLDVFISSVVGGVGSLLGAVLGALLLDGSRNFLSGPAGLLPSAVGVLVILLVLPGGIADLLYRLRDRLLRTWANRRGLHVPALIADSRLPDPITEATAEPATGAAEPAVESTAESTEPPDPADRPGSTDDRPTAAPSTVVPSTVGHPDESGFLSVRGLDVAYGGVQVLFSVDLDIPRGGITALLGTNGAGKSTLLRAVGGVAPITDGTVHLDGIDLRRHRPEQIPAHGIAQMPGGHGVFPSLTVDENLRVATWLFRRDRADAAERIETARRRFPVLADRGRHHAADLSGGQQQQLALAMALLARPKLLLIDELSLGLAPVVVADLLDELRRLRDDGTTILIVEQSVNVALELADHAFFMEKGEIRFSGAADRLLDQPDLVRSVYLGGAREGLRDRAPAAPDAATPGPTATDDHDPDPVGSSAIETIDLGVSFGGIRAVSDVDLRVDDGEIVGLIGPNGAGKTTLFDLISGVTANDTGRVLLHGSDVTERSAATRSRAGLGRSFQDARLFPGLTVEETIAVAFERWLRGDDLLSAAFRLPSSRRAEREVAARVDHAIDSFGLGAFRSKRIGELSTGSRRMVDLACITLHDPSVILLDEPSSGIAQREAEALGPLITDLRDRLHATVLVIEHDIGLISTIADRLIALDDGSVIAAGPPDEVLADPAVITSYLGTDDRTLRRSGVRPGTPTARTAAREGGPR